MSTSDKWVRRFSIDETAKHNGFTIYKITSVLFPIESPEAVTTVSVWKRYSDVQRLHKSMKALHGGLHLRTTFPMLPKYSYFKRFQQEVIEDRAKTIKTLLEFVAEHRLLFTSTDFVNFLQTGWPAPGEGGVINAIRSSLRLPIEETPPLEYQTDEEERSPSHSANSRTEPTPHTAASTDETDFISQIPIYEAAVVEMRASPVKVPAHTDSFESFSSIESIDSDLFDELSRISIDKRAPAVKKSVLPDLIIFDAPSTSEFEDYHTMPRDSETATANSNNTSVYDSESRRSSSRLSVNSKRSALSLSKVESKTKTEDSYVFEAGYMLNLAARCEDLGDYHRAFECYKSGIEKMLIGVQSDTDSQRRALIKEKTNKYLSYAESIYKDHLCGAARSILSEQDGNTSRSLHWPIPMSMLKRSYEDLSLYKVVAILSSSIMLVLQKNDQNCFAMKVKQKVPNNLTEFDEYFLQRTSETRTPVLPTLIPYMVPLHAYIETNNLIFLILSYAPGEKLFDYIKNYTKSMPPTPSKVNLENVFAEPSKTRKVDQLDNVDDQSTNNNASVEEIVLNSQKLLVNVDRALEDKGTKQVDVEMNVEVKAASPSVASMSRNPRDQLPPSALCKWGAEILTAVESLHNCGVICRDLNPSNILLGARGQVTLTYFSYTPGGDMALAALRARPPPGVYAAPELYDAAAARDASRERLCDFWSYGAVMYYLLCGIPLSFYHRSVFTTHTILQLPEGLSVEVESLLTQLLTYDPEERLGAGKDGIEEIKRHPYFKHIDWQEIYDSWVVPD